MEGQKRAQYVQPRRVDGLKAPPRHGVVRWHERRDGRAEDSFQLGSPLGQPSLEIGCHLELEAVRVILMAVAMQHDRRPAFLRLLADVFHKLSVISQGK